MNDASRRNFLVMAGAGAAVVGTAAVIPTSAGAAIPKAKHAAPEIELPAGASEPIVAYIKDPKTGELTVMVGEREVVVRDRDLVARIARTLA